MRSVNRVTMIGHLTADPVFRLTNDGIPYAKFTVATNRRFKNPDGEVKELADFHDVVAWRKTAEICENFLSKGSALYLEGRLTTSMFQNSKGEHKRKTEVVLENLNVLKTNKQPKKDEALATTEEALA